MVEQQQSDIQFALGDVSTRLRDLDERNKIIRERVLLIGRNLIDVKEDSDEEIRRLKREIDFLKRETEKLTKISKSLLIGLDSFVKKEEIVLVERMLKDFQPLEFVRRKDVEEMIDRRLSQDKIGVRFGNG
jgi:SMC interacting uncharacterized protein involved in chromosome segregation